MFKAEKFIFGLQFVEVSVCSCVTPGQDSTVEGHHRGEKQSMAEQLGGSSSKKEASLSLLSHPG